MSRLIDGSWTACDVRLPENAKPMSAPAARAARPNASGFRYDICASLRSASLLSDHLRPVATQAVVGRVFVVAGEGVEAGHALEAARRAGPEVVGAVVGDGGPGEAEAVRSCGIRAAVVHRHGDRRLGAGSERDRRLEDSAVRGAAT